jgi:hypothetical protein
MPGPKIYRRKMVSVRDDVATKGRSSTFGKEWDEFKGEPTRTPKEFEKAAREYFLKYKDEKKDKPTISGLRLAVGVYREEDWEALKRKEGWQDVVGWALLVVSEGYEQQMDGKGTAFALKQLGWREDGSASGKTAGGVKVNFNFTLSAPAELKQIEAIDVQTIEDVGGQG